jgi:hypothetical protein
MFSNSEIHESIFITKVKGNTIFSSRQKILFLTSIGFKTTTVINETFNPYAY